MKVKKAISKKVSKKAKSSSEKEKDDAQEESKAVIEEQEMKEAKAALDNSAIGAGSPPKNENEADTPEEITEESTLMRNLGLSN